MLNKLLGGLVPFLAALVAFAFGAIMLVALGANPLEGLSLIHISEPTRPY